MYLPCIGRIKTERDKKTKTKTSCVEQLHKNWLIIESTKQDNAHNILQLVFNCFTTEGKNL